MGIETSKYPKYIMFALTLVKLFEFMGGFLKSMAIIFILPKLHEMTLNCYPIVYKLLFAWPVGSGQVNLDRFHL